MHLNKSNLYVKKHGGGFSVFISMPDDSRNYLHTNPTAEMTNAVAAKVMLEGQELTTDNTKIIRDGSYLRIAATLQANGLKQRFNSRLLNDLDAQKEFELLVYE